MRVRLGERAARPIRGPHDPPFRPRLHLGGGVCDCCGSRLLRCACAEGRQPIRRTLEREHFGIARRLQFQQLVRRGDPRRPRLLRRRRKCRGIRKRAPERRGQRARIERITERLGIRQAAGQQWRRELVRPRYQWPLFRTLERAKVRLNLPISCHVRGLGLPRAICSALAGPIGPIFNAPWAENRRPRPQKC